MGLSKVKRGCQLAKGKKSCKHKKGVSKRKNKTKKNYSLRAPLHKGHDVHCLRASARRCPSCWCLSPPFVPVLDATVGSSLLGAGVELLVGGGLRSD